MNIFLLLNILFSTSLYAQIRIDKEFAYEFFMSLKNAEALKPLIAEQSRSIIMAYDGRMLINASPMMTYSWNDQAPNCFSKAGDWVSPLLSKELREEFLSKFKISKKDKMPNAKTLWHGEFTQSGVLENFFWDELPDYFNELLKVSMTGLKPVSVVSFFTKTENKKNYLELTVTFTWEGTESALLHFPRYVATSFQMPGYNLSYIVEPAKEIELGVKQKSYKVFLKAISQNNEKKLEKSKMTKKKKSSESTARIRFHNSFSLKYKRNIAHPELARHFKIAICQDFKLN